MNYYTNYSYVHLSSLRLFCHAVDLLHGCGPGQYTMFYMKYKLLLKRGHNW